MQCLLATAFIPGFSGWAPISIRGVRYIDGGFTDNLPQLDHQTVIVSPFCGEADICPKDNNAGLMTVFMNKILFYQKLLLNLLNFYLKNNNS